MDRGKFLATVGLLAILGFGLYTAYIGPNNDNVAFARCIDSSVNEFRDDDRPRVEDIRASILECAEARGLTSVEPDDVAIRTYKVGKNLWSIQAVVKYRRRVQFLGFRFDRDFQADNHYAT